MSIELTPNTSFSADRRVSAPYRAGICRNKRSYLKSRLPDIVIGQSHITMLKQCHVSVAKPPQMLQLAPIISATITITCRIGYPSGF